MVEARQMEEFFLHPSQIGACRVEFHLAFQTAQNRKPQPLVYSL